MRQAERIRLLEEQARQEEADAVVKRRKDLDRHGSTKKLSRGRSRSRGITEPPRQAEKKFRKTDHTARPMRGPPGRSATRTPMPLRSLPRAQRSRARGQSVAVRHLYRIGARPFFGGRPGEIVEAEFPRRRLPKERSAWQAAGHNDRSPTRYEQHRSLPST